MHDYSKFIIDKLDDENKRLKKIDKVISKGGKNTSKLTKFEEILKINDRNIKIKELLTSIKDDEFRSKIEELL